MTSSRKHVVLAPTLNTFKNGLYRHWGQFHYDLEKPPHTHGRYEGAYVALDNEELTYDMNYLLLLSIDMESTEAEEDIFSRGLRDVSKKTGQNKRTEHIYNRHT